MIDKPTWFYNFYIPMAIYQPRCQINNKMTSWFSEASFLLVGGAITILKNDGVRQWGWDDIPYMKWKKHV
jgi:hypothetical protein